MCKTRPAGRIRPATLSCPAREMCLNYNGNRPAACHRPPLHYTIDGLSCVPLHRLKTNVMTTIIFFDNALLNARWIVWIVISNDISVERHGSVVVNTSAWHAAGRRFDSRTRHVSLLGVNIWLSKLEIVYLCVFRT